MLANVVRSTTSGIAGAYATAPSWLLRCISTTNTPLSNVPVDQDWTQHSNVEFSIRPSVLSPLFATYTRNAEASAQQTGLSLQLQAQDFLQGMIDLKDSEADQLYSYRISQYDKLLKSLDNLLSKSQTPSCSSKEDAVAHFEMLSEQAKQGDRSYRKFWQLVTGDINIWQHWTSEFASKYDHYPSLEPMEVIYNKRDRDNQDMRRLRSLAMKQVAQDARQLKSAKAVDQQAVHTSGKRKTCVANIVLQPGPGSIFVNDKPFDYYFRDFFLRAHVLKPLFVTDTLGQYSFKAVVAGGGISGQAQAVRHAVSKAIHKLHPQLGPVLAKADLLEHDSRVVERKKPGKKKARKSFTWVKR